MSIPSFAVLYTEIGLEHNMSLATLRAAFWTIFFCLVYPFLEKKSTQ